MANLAQNLAMAQAAITNAKSKVAAASNVREDRLEREGGIEAVIARYRQEVRPQAAPAPPPQTFQEKRQFWQAREARVAAAPLARPAAPAAPGPVTQLMLELYTARCSLTRRNRLLAQQLGRDLTHKEHIEFSAQTAEACGLGNCWEQASIAFVYLRDHGASPIDFMFFTAPGYDHAFVIIGRAQFSNFSNLRTWGPNAVWCDPWQGRTGRAFAIADFIAGRVRNLDAIYKLNTAELVGAGKPISFWRVG
jgi:hypothetical protein